MAPAKKKQLVTELSVLLLLISHVVQFVEINWQRLFMKIYPCTVTLLTLALAGCGGGGGSSSTTPSTPAVSAAQQNYESVALSSNGGLHYVIGSLGFTSSSSGALSISSGSYFYTDDSSIPLTPANGAQPISVAYSTTAKTLPLPTISGGARYLVNGTVYTAAFPAQAQVSYSGNNILESYLATDGKTVVRAFLGTSYSSTGLTGLIGSSPAELFSGSMLGLITNTVNGAPLYNQQANWQTGAAYLKVVRQYSGDTLFVGDCGVATTGPNITPCSTTVAALEGWFPRVSTTDGVTYQIGDGQIVTLAGVRAWVANTSLNTVNPQYRVYYQRNGAIYSGILTKDGTPLQIPALGSGAAQNFYIFLNNAALQSVKSAVNF
jgi:hypothetical protein